VTARGISSVTKNKAITAKTIRHFTALDTINTSIIKFLKNNGTYVDLSCRIMHLQSKSQIALEGTR
ncbi:MAG: hypothetical protein ACI3XC_07195, partial [Phascolarctobacterium sp.]